MKREKRLISIARLKAGLSSVVADVASGAEVIITDHNRPVARLSGLKRIPPLPRKGKGDIDLPRPIPLKGGAPESGRLIREIRDEE